MEHLVLCQDLQIEQRIKLMFLSANTSIRYVRYTHTQTYAVQMSLFLIVIKNFQSPGVWHKY